MSQENMRYVSFSFLVFFATLLEHPRPIVASPVGTATRSPKRHLFLITTSIHNNNSSLSSKTTENYLKNLRLLLRYEQEYLTTVASTINAKTLNSTSRKYEAPTIPMHARTTPTTASKSGNLIFRKDKEQDELVAIQQLLMHYDKRELFEIIKDTTNRIYAKDICGHRHAIDKNKLFFYLPLDYCNNNNDNNRNTNYYYRANVDRGGEHLMAHLCSTMSYGNDNQDSATTTQTMTTKNRNEINSFYRNNRSVASVEQATAAIEATSASDRESIIFMAYQPPKLIANLTKWLSEARPSMILVLSPASGQLKIFGQSQTTIVSKFPPFLEFFVQRMQRYFSNYVYEDMSRPAYDGQYFLTAYKSGAGGGDGAVSAPASSVVN